MGFTPLEGVRRSHQNRDHTGLVHTEEWKMDPLFAAPGRATVTFKILVDFLTPLFGCRFVFAMTGEMYATF